MKTYLPEGLARPKPDPGGLDTPFWEGMRNSRLLLQFCNSCKHWQWGPEWLCHRCHSFDLSYREAQPAGRIFSWERVWHPVHTALVGHGPYLLVLVELPEADGVRIIGNLLGDPQQQVTIGARVQGEFEHHTEAPEPFSLLHWRPA